MPELDELSVFKRSLELQAKSFDDRLKLKTDAILRAKENNALKEAQLFINKQITDFQLSQAQNPGGDPIATTKQFADELRGSLVSFTEKMSDDGAKAFNISLDTSLNKLSISAIGEAEKIEKERSKEVSSSLLALTEQSSNQGNVQQAVSNLETYAEHLNDMEAQGQIGGDEKVEMVSKAKNNTFKSLSNSYIADSHVQEAELSPEVAYSNLMNAYAVFKDNLDAVSKKTMAERLKTLKNKVNSVSKESLDTSKEVFNTAKNNLLESPDPLNYQSFTAKSLDYLEKLRKSRNDKNKDQVDRKIARATAQMYVVDIFRNRPELLNSSVEVDDLKEVFKDTVDFNSDYGVFFLSELSNYKEKFNTKSNEGAYKLDEWRAKIGSETDSADIEYGAKEKSPDISTDEFQVQENEGFNSQYLPAIQTMVAKAKRAFDLKDTVSGSRYMRLQRDDEVQVKESIKNMMLSGNLKEVSNTLAYLNRNNIEFSYGVDEETKISNTVLNTMLSQTQQFTVSGVPELGRMANTFLRGFSLLVEQGDDQRKRENIKLYGDLISLVRKNPGVMEDINVITSDLDAGTKFLALSILGQVHDNPGIRGRVGGADNIRNIMNMSEELTAQWDAYSDSVKKVGESVFIRNKGTFSQGFFQGFAGAGEGSGIETLSNSINPAGIELLFRSRSPSVAGRSYMDARLSATVLTLLKIGLPDQDWSYNSLKENRVVMKETSEGELTLFIANKDNSPSRPLVVGGKPVKVFAKDLKDYEERMVSGVLSDSDSKDVKEVRNWWSNWSGLFPHTKMIDITLRALNTSRADARALKRGFNSSDLVNYSADVFSSGLSEDEKSSLYHSSIYENSLDEVRMGMKNIPVQYWINKATSKWLGTSIKEKKEVIEFLSRIAEEQSGREEAE